MRACVCFAGLIAISVLAPNAVFAAVPNSLLLNEANCVSGGDFLQNGNTDTSLGRLQGNGQNWFEFVVAQGDDLGGGSFSNTLDLRGWKVEWSYFDAANKQGSGVITFTNDSLWAAVPRGTMLTVSEWQKSWYLDEGGLQHKGGINGLGNQRGDAYDAQIHTLLDLKTDTAWNPAVDDWHINVYAGERNADASFRFFNFSGTVTEPDGDDVDTLPDVFAIGVDNGAGLFAINNDSWQFTIKDAAGNIIQGPIGESVSGGWGGGGINSQENMKLEAFPLGTNPTQASYLGITPQLYKDGASSTFAKPNIWSSGSFTQDLSPLRSWWTAPQSGDFDGDGDVDGADFVVWQTNYPQASGVMLPQGDGNGDGIINGADFAVWQSSFSQPSASSPVPEPSVFILTLIGAGCLVAVRQRRSL